MLFNTLPGSEPGLVAPSPTCSVPAPIVVPPEKVLAVLVSTTAPPVAMLLIRRLVGPATSVNADWKISVPPPPPRR